MAQNAQASGHARPGARLSREELKRRLFRELVQAVKKLVDMALRKLKSIRRLFGYRMSLPRAGKKVLEHYSRQGHPRDDQQVPAPLLEAFTVLGREEFVRIKELGDAIRNSDHVPLSEAQRQAARQIFTSVSSNGNPHDDWHHHRSSSMATTHPWAVMPARA